MSFRQRFFAAAVAAMAFLAAAPEGFAQTMARVKDIASLQSGRENQLIGYGLVVGLQGSGDNMRASPFTEQSMRAMLQNLGISMQGNQTSSKNVAAVMVTANLPPFASPGSRLDVNISSLGDASSLRGGTLIMTSMSGADGQIYAVAQGSVIVSGFNAGGQAAQVTEGVTTAGRVPGGAIIERELPSQFKDSVNLVLQLRNPDFSTAIRIADTINNYARTSYNEPIAEARDSQVVYIQKPRTADLTRLMASIENLAVETDTPAKVVINERTGTIIIGADVRVSRVAVSYGTLTVQVTEMPQVVQPAPFSRGQTAVQEQTDIQAMKSGGPVAILEGPSLRSLVAGLNNIGVKPDGIIAILQGIKSAGALQAELVLQ
ncbi:MULTISPECIES: flagellar basal body P-ring protein FlgI [Rhizobium/Agrobacterium group]|jgi:flagellar P-ring protein precursor FlgI|uniref:Flagellar P-ring protein n=3 Tax=Rhizobium/Agrobacterium group TaxID=227290 RepID=A0AA92C364_RHIRH|nr:flagellar basal body P-ring protein FlgI [Agrobacterium tumefaciens]PVE54138.1 flagellar biosynthesis protein FlgI [Rhizobium rhizogenes]PVE66630.1 flagellar biosynthesis protein FlgI [Agrobacterium tumefaciens]PVE76618.1 flagellar biosynthesis protein FlgI [Sphingomonas sp. TPD3009]TBN17148.1 flagellar basal body P-ring protein FlgI [Agrobacterium cavarae]